MGQSLINLLLAFDFASLIASPFFWLGILVGALLTVSIIALIVTHRKYLVIYNDGGETTVEKYRLGESFTTFIPTKEGYVFGGWFIDEACALRLVDTVMESRKPFNLYAKWYDENNCPLVFQKPQAVAAVNLPNDENEAIDTEAEETAAVINDENEVMSDAEYYTLFFESLKREMLSYGKVGDLAALGIKQSEVAAKMFLRDDSVELYFAKTATLNESNIELSAASGDDYVQTPFKYTVKSDEDFDTALTLVNVLMTEKGLANIGEPKEEIKITDDEKKNGFSYVIIYNKVAKTLSEYFLLIREFARSFVLFEAREGLKNGAMLIKMYLKADAVYLYLAVSPTENKLEKSSFEDTPSELKINNIDGVQLAYSLIEKMMLDNGLERDNEGLEQFDNTAELKEGQGYGYRISL